MVKAMRIISVVGMLLAIFLPMSSVSASTFPGRNGAVVVAVKNNSTSTIWRIAPNGKEKKLVSRAYDPTWSPDGQHLAFIANGRLQIMNAKGGERRYLTFTPGYKESSPVWSSNGRRLAFVRTTISGRSAIFSVAATGGNETPISGWSQQWNFRSPSWSPDSRRIVYERFNANEAGLLIFSAHEAKKLTDLSDVTKSSRVSWSLNGKKILFQDSTDQVYTIWPDGTHRTVISDGDSHDAVWSPSGNRIAFIEDDGISLVDARGDVMQLGLDDSYSDLTHVIWSPDEAKLMFVAIKDGRQGVFEGTINDKSLIVIPLLYGEITSISWQSK